MVIMGLNDVTLTLEEAISKRVDVADMSHLLLLGKFEFGGGPIFKVVLEC